MRTRVSKEKLAELKAAREKKRVSKTKAVTETTAAAQSVEAFAKRGARGAAKKSSPKKSSTGYGPAYAKRLVAEVDEMISGGNDFTNASPRHMVGLYMWCHLKVYGIECSELRSKLMQTALRLSGLRLKNEFDSNPEKFVAFIRWTWQREQYLEDRRRDEGSGKRLPWNAIFQWRTKLDDYRMAMARQRVRDGEIDD
jgi:hypothetical protein